MQEYVRIMRACDILDFRLTCNIDVSTFILNTCEYIDRFNRDIVVIGCKCVSIGDSALQALLYTEKMSFSLKSSSYYYF